jgi:tetratricopeptide (TPR) repeat protein
VVANIDKAYCGIGLSYDKLGEFKEAIEAFKKAIEFNSNNDNAYYNNMGLVYLKLSGFVIVSKSYIVMSPITIRINLNGFFASLNCLLKFFSFRALFSIRCQRPFNTTSQHY